MPVFFRDLAGFGPVWLQSARIQVGPAPIDGGIFKLRPALSAVSPACAPGLNKLHALAFYAILTAGFCKEPSFQKNCIV
jgi:hypothetical protein